MNYAQDALFWYLHNIHVRALASLLTAPAPIIYKNEISVKELLGENGFAFLKQLDKNPQILLSAVEDFDDIDIDEYTQKLFDFWIENAPHKNQLNGKKIRLSFGIYSKDNYPLNYSTKNQVLTRGIVYAKQSEKLTKFSPTVWRCEEVEKLPKIDKDTQCWTDISYSLPEWIAPALRTQKSHKKITIEQKDCFYIFALLNLCPDGLWRETERFVIDKLNYGNI